MLWVWRAVAGATLLEGHDLELATEDTLVEGHSFGSVACEAEV